jgi:RimJ/RimL family protein N-acetyltransferase
MIARDTNRVAEWTLARLGAVWVPGTGQAIGLEREGQLVAGVVFEGWNGASVRMHVAAEPGSQWLNREYLHLCFWYVFEQLGCHTAIALVAESNSASRRFTTHLGFRLKATLEDCHPDGALLIYTMTKAQCKWLSLRIPDGQAERTPAS